MDFTYGHLDISSEIETQTIVSLLDTGQWTLHGRRNRVFILPSGNGTIAYENEEFSLSAPCLVLVPSGKPALLTLNAGSRGAWLALSDKALGQVSLPGSIAEDVRRLALRPQFGTRIDRDNALRLASLLSNMETELRENRPGAQDMARHQLAVACIMIWRASDLPPGLAQPSPRAIVNNFLQAVDLNMRSHWSVADYARYLGVSTDRLNSAVKRATGKSPLSLIHARLINEACQMIESSGMQFSEIATHLGFEDAAYFSRFFKRLSGKTPRQYRLEATRTHSQMAHSFAAWP